MKNLFYVLLTFLLLTNCKSNTTEEEVTTDFPDVVVDRIGFGSCHHQLFKPFKAFQSLANENVDLFLFNGDNIYGDLFAIAPGTEEFMRNSYAKLFENRDFKTFYNSVPFITTWDDHDFGQNDGVTNNPAKHMAKRLFFEVWNIPKNHPRRNNPDGAIYGSYYYGPADKRVQILVLDMRWNQSVRTGNQISGWNQQLNPSKTILGNKQWEWLEEELKKPAKVRVVMSSLQFACNYTSNEAWDVFPLERKKMLDLIKSTGAEGLFFVSGDVHYGELSGITDEPGLYPIYDLTSSGMTHLSGPGENIYRIGEPFENLNYGIIDIDWSATPANVSLEVRNVKGEAVIQKLVSLDELKF